jgi:fucose permease
VPATLLAGCFLIYAVASVVDALKGATLSLVLTETGFSYSLGGGIVTSFYLGYMAATLAAGIVSDWLGKRAVLLLAAAILAFGMLGLARTEAAAGFIAFSFVNGFGGGAAVLGGNRLIASLLPDRAGRYLNLLGATFGFVAMLTPHYVAFLGGLGRSWRDSYAFLAAGALLCLAWFALQSCPGEGAGRASLSRTSAIFRAVMADRVRWFYLVLLFYVSVEAGVGTWLIEYLVRHRGFPAETGNGCLSLFFGGIMAGRFLGGLFVERVGRARSLRLASLASGLCIVLGSFGPGWLVLFLPLSGLFFSLIFPTATACVSSASAQNPGAVLGVLFAFASLGGMAGPWLIGLANDFLGLEWGIRLAAFFSLGLAVSVHFAVKPRR